MVHFVHNFGFWVICYSSLRSIHKYFNGTADDRKCFDYYISSDQNHLKRPDKNCSYNLFFISFPKHFQDKSYHFKLFSSFICPYWYSTRAICIKISLKKSYVKSTSYAFSLNKNTHTHIDTQENKNFSETNTEIYLIGHPNKQQYYCNSKINDLQCNIYY